MEAEKEQPSDLLERVKRITEHKEPSTFTTAKTAEPKAEQKTTSSFWEQSNDDFEEPTTPKPKSPEATTEAEPVKKLTEKAKKGSAKTAVGMLDLTQRVICEPIINYKFKKKFTKSEIERITNADEKDEKDISDADRKLMAKFERLLEKKEKLSAKIPFDDKEKEELTDAFFNYFDFKEKSLPPEWYLVFAVLNTTGKRIIDITFD